MSSSTWNVTEVNVLLGTNNTAIDFISEILYGNLLLKHNEKLPLEKEVVKILQYS